MILARLRRHGRPPLLMATVLGLVLALLLTRMYLLLG